MDDLQQAVNASPYNEGPHRAVPQSGDEHGGQQVGVRANIAFPVAPQADVNVIADPPGQRDVPAAPELLRAPAYVWGFEVIREAHAHHDAEPDGHVRVGREVVVDVEAERISRHPGLGPGQGGAFVEQFFHDRGQLVGDDDFLDHPDREQIDAESDVVPGDFLLG